MNKYCPNRNSKEYKELVEIFGEDKTYLLWKRNHDSLDKAPNGADSKLFLSLLDYYKGDRKKALIAKAKTLTDEFFNWFGDWTSEDKLNVSKVLDENGEPLVVYHGGAPGILIFEHSKPGLSTTGTGYYEDPNTKERIPVDSERTMFFSDNRSVAESYRDLFGIKKFLNIFSKVDILIGYLADPNWFFKSSGDGALFKKLFKNPDADLISLLDELNVFNPRFGRLKNYYISITGENKKLNDKEKKAFRDMLIEVRKTLRDYTESWLMNRSDWMNHFRQMQEVVLEYNNESGITRLLNGEIPKQLVKEYQIYKHIEKQRENLGLEKLDNYLDVHISTSNKGYSGLRYDGENLKVFSSFDVKLVKEFDRESLKNILEMYDAVSKAAIRDMEQEEIYSRVYSKGELYPTFLNIKNPLSHDYDGTHQGLGYKENKKYPFGYVAARLVNKAIKDGNDGVIYENLYDPYLANNYGVFDPVQIKSIDNNGNFSTVDKNIYHNLSPLNTAQLIKSAILQQNITRVGPRGGIYITDGNLKHKQELISRIAHNFGASVDFYPHGKFYIITNSHTAEVEGSVDSIAEGTDQNQEFIDAIISHLLEKFEGVRVRFLNEDEVPRGIKRNANCYVKGDTIYLIRGRITADTTIEEFLHPLLLAVYAQNKQLFNNLVKQAKQEFPVLWAKIQDTYNNAEGFNDFNRDCEIAAQSLSRYAKIGFKSNTHKKSLSELALSTLEAIAKFIYDAFSGLIHGDGYIDIKKLPKMSLRSFSDLVIARDSKFKMLFTDGVQYSISAQHKTDQEIAEGITKRFNVLYRAYEKMPNKDAKREQLENKIFEVYNELQLNQDLQAVRIALDFAIERIGVIDNATGLPTNNNSVLGYLTKLSQTPEPFSNVTPLNLVDAYSNSIGFFENLLENYIPDLINTKLTTEDRFKISELRTSIASAKALWTQAMVVVGDKIVDQQIDNEVDASDEDKADMKVVAKDWLHKNIMYGDISSFTSYVFNYGYSTNPIIKQAFHLIQHAETKTLEEIHPIAQKVARDFRAADNGFKQIKNWLTILQEHDYKGIPTGYFIRETNYGQYEQDLEAFIKELNDRYTNDYGHTYIDDGNGIIINSLTGELAEEEEWIGGVEPTYIKYLKEIEHWKCEHAHRRYTEKYYMERMSEPYKGSLDPMETNTNKFGHGLSPKTLSRYNHILSNINYYLDKCSDPKTNLTYPERLNDLDKASLDAWRDALDQLQNPYNEDGTPKSDDDRQMAFEIRAWQKWLGDKLRTDVKMDEFQDELLKVQAEAAKTGNYKPVYDFIKYNSRVGINPYFIELTIGRYSKTNPTDQDVIHAQYLRQALQNLVKTSSGYTRDLSKMENRPEFWLNCKHMDQIIEDGKAKQDPDFAKMFDENFGFDEILYRDEYGFAIDSSGNQVKPEDEHMHNDLRTYRQYIIDKYTNLAYNNPSRTILGLNDAAGNPIVFNGTVDQVRSVIEKLFSYKKETVDSAGNISIEYVPLTIFSMMTPKKDTFFNTKTGRNELTMIQVPSGRFAEKYDFNNYINEHYDKSNLNAEQPRHDYSDSRGNVYDNTKAYNEAMSNPAVARLYDTLINTMQLAQDAYSTKNRRFNYRLPQIEADGMQIMSRLIQNGFKNTASALFESLTTVQENDESMRTKDDYMTSPDGSVATDVPLKFVRKLKDPSRLTTDVVGSVILFMNMALNYKNKSVIDAELKTLRYNMDPNFRSGVELEKDEFAPGDDQESVDMFDSMLNNHMYNNQWVKAPQTGADSKSMVAWKKAMRKVHRLETTQMLALNLFSMIVGFGDSMTRIFKESIMGKYMTIIDSVTSLADILVRYTIPVIANIGNPVANNKLTRAMQRNGISKGIHQTYEHANYGRTRRIFYNLLMGGFSMLDWMANALLLRSFYNNIRLYQGGVVETGFYSLYELELAFVKAGHKKSEAILAHTLSTRTLWGAYDKYMNLKPEFSDETDPNFICHVSQKTKTRVRTKTLQRSALYNGMNPDNDLPTYKTKLIGAFVGAMRGWLTLAIQHLFAGGSDNIVKNVHRVEDYKIKLGKTFKIHRTVADKLTDELRERRMSWNYETGTPNDQIYVGLARSFNTLGKKLWRYATLNAADAKKAKFSYVEKYAWRDALVYMGILGLCLIAWPMLNELAAAVPPPKDREGAGPMSVTDVPRWFNERYIGDQYWKMQASDIGFRIIESQITSIDPTSAMDVVNSITTLQSGVNEHIGIVKAAGDVLGVSGHSMDEVVKQGGYKYYTRGERNLYKALGPLDNMKTAFTYYGIKTNQDFYTNTYGGVYRFFGYDFKHDTKKEGDLGLGLDLDLDLGLDLDLDL